MSGKRPFRFQQFVIEDDRCAMKVGTDGVLLGAWANVEGCKRLLDIGVGSGLIGLMLAQRTDATGALIEGIDLDGEAAAQARENVALTPWADRIVVFQSSLQEFADCENLGGFDHCVCNPPYFPESYPSEDLRRRAARQTTRLSREALFFKSSDLLKPTGKLSLILPFDQLKATNRVAEETGFSLTRQTSVRSLPNKPFKRVLLEYELGPRRKKLLEDELTIEVQRHEFTEDYANLTRAFHLRYQN